MPAVATDIVSHAAAAVANGRANPVVSLPSAAPLFRLDAAASGWLVDSGRIDLFAVALVEGQPTGARHPLCSVPAGELILALPPMPDSAVIGVGQLDTQLVCLGPDDIADWPADARAALVEGWIVRIAAAACGEVAFAVELAAEPGRQVALAANQRLHAPRGAVWVTALVGALSAGDGIVVADGPFPIAAGLSLRAETDCAVDCVAPAQTLAGGMDFAGIDRFHRIICTAVSGRLAAEEEAARAQIAARAEVDRRSIAGAVQRLASVVAPAPSQSTATTGSDPLVFTVGEVAAHHGIVLSRTPRSMQTADLAVRTLAQANGIGLRFVLLREGWWRRENGALLCWRGNDRHPVAALPDGQAGYRLLDPTDNTALPVGEALADEFAPQAVMFYRGLPSASASIASLARFAVRGISDEATTILALGLVSAALAALVPVATGYLFAAAVPRAESGQVLAVVLGLVLAALGSAVFGVTRGFALVRLEGRLEAAMQPALMLRLLGLPVNFFRGLSTGELMNRLLSIQAVRQLLAGNTLASLLSALFGTVSFAIILLYSPWLALLSLVLVVVAGAMTAGLAIGELAKERARLVLRGREDGLVVQLLQGIAKLRVAAGEARAFGVWADLFARQKRLFLARQRYAAASDIFAEVYPIVALLALFAASAQFLGMSGKGPSLSLGAFLAINAAFGQLLVATMTVSRTLATSLELIPLFERLRPILSTAPEARADKTETPALSGRIELSHVSFRYVQGTPLVLDDISLRIEPGEFVALVGPSGSGKSSLLRLLLGFEIPEIGDIVYDGRSLTTLDAASLRRQIGVVLQHCQITSGSIFENITSGLPYTLEDAWEAARLAGIDGEIRELPMGMHTFLMEGSSTLSGGQRQRLMIARALISRPRVLLFDEATSALDNRSQAVVMQSLERLSATRIVIAHRLSTIERADRIFVLDRGRLVEAGGYAELLAAGGPFSQLARRQLL